MEEWRAVHGWPQYEASSDGRIRHAVTQRVRQPWWNARFKGWQLTLGGRIRYRSYFVHQVVALAFLGACPPDHEVGHKDNDRDNNRSGNLEYVTHLENMAYAARQGRMARGERARASKLTADQVCEIRRLYKRGVRGSGTRVLGQRFGVTANTIGRIVTRQYWAWL